MRGVWSLISWDFLLFARKLFNFIARGLFNCFLLYLVQLFCPRLVQFFLSRLYSYLPHFFKSYLIILLTIFLSFVLFLVWGYITTIDANVHNSIEVCSTMFCICCTTFKIFMTTINMFLHVSVYGMYFLYLIFLHIQNPLINGHFLCCTRAFIGWSK